MRLFAAQSLALCMSLGALPRRFVAPWLWIFTTRNLVDLRCMESKLDHITDLCCVEASSPEKQFSTYSHHPGIVFFAGDADAR